MRPVLRVLKIAVLILRYPPAGAIMSPPRVSVEAIRDDVFSFMVETTLEKVAVYVSILEMVMDPAGFVIAVELRRSCDACCALIVAYTVRVLVAIELDAVRFSVLIPGTVIASEKRRSLDLYVIYFSLNVRELAS